MNFETYTLSLARNSIAIYFHIKQIPFRLSPTFNELSRSNWYKTAEAPFSTSKTHKGGTHFPIKCSPSKAFRHTSTSLKRIVLGNPRNVAEGWKRRIVATRAKHSMNAFTKLLRQMTNNTFRCHKIKQFYSGEEKGSETRDEINKNIIPN